MPDRRRSRRSVIEAQQRPPKSVQIRPGDRGWLLSVARCRPNGSPSPGSASQAGANRSCPPGREGGGPPAPGSCSRAGGRSTRPADQAERLPAIGIDPRESRPGHPCQRARGVGLGPAGGWTGVDRDPSAATGPRPAPGRRGRLVRARAARRSPGVGTCVDELAGRQRLTCLWATGKMSPCSRDTGRSQRWLNPQRPLLLGT